MKLKATLEALYSERDLYGNCYWALRYTDHRTGKAARGTVSGGESNIYGIRRATDRARKLDTWDDSITFRVVALKKREFKWLTKDWPYAGCGPDELYQFIKRELRRKVEA